ncbi:hypothetical protein AQBE111736_02505 [Aquirufa beregesia]
MLAVLMINDSLILSTVKNTHEPSKVWIDQFSDINTAGQSSDEVQDMEEEGFAFLLQPASHIKLFQVNQSELVVQLKANPYQDISLDMIYPPPQLSA